MTQGTPMITLFPGAPPVSGLPVSQPAVGEDASPFANLFAQWTDPATGAPILLNPEIAYIPPPPAAAPKNAALPVVQTVKETPEAQTEPETTMSNSPLWMAMAGAVLAPAPSAPIRQPEAEEAILQASLTNEVTVERPAYRDAAAPIPLLEVPAVSMTAEAAPLFMHAPAAPVAGSPYSEQSSTVKPPEERTFLGRPAQSPPPLARADAAAAARGAPPPVEKPPPEPNALKPIPNRTMQALEVDAVSKTIGEPKAPLSFPIEMPEGSAPVAAPSQTGVTAPSQTGIAEPAPHAASARPAPVAAPTASVKPMPSAPSDTAPKPAHLSAQTAETDYSEQTPTAAFVSTTADPAVVSTPVSLLTSGPARQKERVVLTEIGKPAEPHGVQTAGLRSVGSPTPSPETPTKVSGMPEVAGPSLPQSGAVPHKETLVLHVTPVVPETVKPSEGSMSPVAAAPTKLSGMPEVGQRAAISPAPSPLRPSAPANKGAVQTVLAAEQPMAAFESPQGAETSLKTQSAAAPESSAPNRASMPPTSVMPQQVVIAQPAVIATVTMPAEGMRTPAPMPPVAMRGMSQSPEGSPAEPVMAFVVSARPEAAVLAETPRSLSVSAEASGRAFNTQKAIPVLDSVRKEAVLSTERMPSAVSTAVPISEVAVSDSEPALRPTAATAMEGAVPTSSTPTAPISAKAIPRLVSSSGAPATPKSAPSAEPEAIPMTQALHPEKLETSSGERGSRPSKAVFPEAHPLAQTRASLSAEPIETVAQTEAGQPEAASSSDAEADSAGVWERAALRTERAAIPITTEPETISESQPLPAKSGIAASPAAPTEGPANPLNAGQEAVSEEEMAVLPLRDEAQATVEETRLRNEVADRSEPIRRPAPTASDSAADGIEGEHKPVATPVAASAHASPTAHTERAQTPSAAEQQDRVRVVEQILQKLETMRLTQGRQEITLHLKPEHLGRLQVTILTDRENVFARIVAETPQIRQAVESGRDALREALEQRGMTLQHLDVSSQQGHGGGRQMPFDPEPFASSARAYRVSGHAEAEKTETPRPSVVTPSRLAGRVDYVA